MRNQLELASMGIEVPDPALLTPLFADVIGLVPGDAGPAGTETWCNDDKAQRALQPGDILETWIEGIGAIRNRIVAET